MAKGRATRRLLFGLSAAVFALLIVAGLIPNPFPGLWAWVAEDRPLAPDLAWQHRLGARPDTAAAAGDTITVATGSTGHLFARGTGEEVTLTAGTDDHWDVDWLVVAGTGADAVVIARPDGEDGYEVRTPDGRAAREDQAAVAVWGFSDGWVDLRCDRRVCHARRYTLDRLEPVWRTDLPGERSGMLGANPALAAPRVADAARIDAGVSGPPRRPPVLGFTVTRRGTDLVAAVETATGRVLSVWEQADDERVIVVDGRVVRSRMTRHNGVCVSTVTGYDPVTTEPVWGPVPHHLWGTGDVGCEQRTPPLAGGSAVTAVSADGRPMVFDAYDGRVLWTGELTERIEALSANYVMVRDSDGATVHGIALGADADPAWSRRVDESAELVVARCGLIVADRHPNRLYLWDPATGEDLLSVSTSAKALACAPDGMLITERRSVAFARFDGATAPPAAGRPPDEGDPPVDAK